MPSNAAVYEQPDVVQEYLRHHSLTRGEQKILKEGEALFRDKKVLDLGVGAGRTTPALTALVAEYWGIDYSASMVEACKARFQKMSKARFLQDDARSLSNCPDNYFDAVFFSFNGIDCIDTIEGRKAALDAASRILVQNGVFIFSFHNALYLQRLYAYHWQKNPLRWWANLRRWQQLRKLNGAMDQYKDKPAFFIRDGGEDFRLSICYMLPSAQARMLIDSGFRITRCIASLSGKEVMTDRIDEATDCWLYYLCEKA